MQACISQFSPFGGFVDMLYCCVIDEFPQPGKNMSGAFYATQVALRHSHLDVPQMKVFLLLVLLEVILQNYYEYSAGNAATQSILPERRSGLLTKDLSALATESVNPSIFSTYALAVNDIEATL